MNMSRLLAGFAILVVLVPANAKDEKISLRGTPASVSPATDDQQKAGVLGTLLMEGQKDKDTEYDKAMVKATKATKIFRRVGRELKPASFNDLKPNVKLEIQFAGPVTSSFPPMATAGKIVIYGR